MSDFNRENHWETIYQTKSIDEVSWYEPTPQTSLDLIQQNNPSYSAKIIDIGGGDSFLVDHLLELGYQNITVLDISEKALNRAKKRLGKKAEQVKWIVADITHFIPSENYDIWHDRAAFHFLTTAQEIKDYVTTAKNALSKNGQLIIGTFAEDGPLKCSGIEITRYSENTLKDCFKNDFNLENCTSYNHPTPFNTSQNFIFCSFTKF
jgi:ubiquinone/menaquinone biosynthesis C-methylase UbiE